MDDHQNFRSNKATIPEAILWENPPSLDHTTSTLQVSFSDNSNLIDLPGGILELRLKQDTLDDLLEHGNLLFDNFEGSGLVEALDQAINCWRSAIPLVADSDADRPKILNALGYAYLTRFERLGELQDLEHSIQFGEKALSLTLEGHEEMAERLGNLGNTYLTRFERLGELLDLNKAISCGEEAVLLAPPGHTSRAGQLNNLGVSYEIRFGRLGDLVDLNKAIDCGAEAVSLTPNDHLGKARRLSNLGISHRTRFELKGDLLDLRKAIEYGLKAISLAPDQDVDKPGMLDSLGSTYVIRFKRLGNLRDLGESIKHGAQAILLTPDGHATRPGRISNLANSYLARFEHLGELPDLNKAIEYGEEAVILTPVGYANGPAHLSNLGNAYRARYECQDELLDLSKSIECGEQAVLHTPEDHADRPVRLGNLGVSYQIRFGRVGELSDLNKAIEYGSEAVLLTPKDHADKPGRLGNLEISYQARFKRLGELPDLNMAIECGVKAVGLLPKGHSDRPGQLSNLGCSYQARFEARGELPDLTKAIECGTEAVLLIPDGHAARPRMIDNLGSSYMTQFKQTGEILDLNKAIEYGTEAILLTPDDHPAKPNMLNNLGNYYLVRFVHSGELLDIQNAIHYGEEAVSFTPDGHAVRPSRLSNLGNSYLVRYGQSNTRYDLESAIRCYRDAAKSFAGSPSERLYACRRWAQLASHDTTPESPAYSAYQQAMLLLPQLIWIGTTIDRRYSLIAYLGDFATEAASFAIRINNLPLALEWLEAGRSIVWGQIAQLRTPFELLSTYDSDLASRLKEVSQRLEQAGTRPSSEPSLRANGKDLTKEANEHTQLALEWNLLLSKARVIPGFVNFLCPPKSNMLLRAAKLHPIAVISVHHSRCDALIIQPKVNTVSHVPLAKFSVESALAARKRLVSLVRHRRPGHLSKVGLLERSADSLWSGIIHPVLESLGYLNKLPVDQLPHITWCTTGLLSFLPLHAAECYDQSHSNTFDFVISSYTPTLSALLTNGSRDPGPHPDLGILAVGQEHTPGCDSLPSTVAELATIKKRAQTIPYLQLENDKATIDEVLSAMERFSWVHLACHGSQDTTDPTKSAFRLHDGNLTLATISKRSFQNKGFAFLSACQTATGDEDLPDEAVHLAAGMLMAGYPSVIGTMWSIADEDGPRVADKVYALLLKDGKMDNTKAARALHEAVAELRAMEDMPFERWAPFIHIGQ